MGDYIAVFYENVCIYAGMKYETLNFARHLSVEFCIHLFRHNLGALNENVSNNIQYLMSFNFKLTKQKLATKMHNFWGFLRDLKLRNVSFVSIKMTHI